MSTFVDENVPGMYVTYFLFEKLKLITCSDDVVQQIPDFSLQKIFPQLVTILDLGFEHELVVVEGKLCEERGTLAMPLEPHSPTDSKECLMGSKMTYLLSESSIWFMDLSQVL